MPVREPPIVRWVRRGFQHDDRLRSVCIVCRRDLEAPLPRGTAGFCGEVCEFAHLEGRA